MARKATVEAPRARMSRYARVKSILDTAARGSASDHGGAGRFWDDVGKLKATPSKRPYALRAEMSLFSLAM